MSFHHIPCGECFFCGRRMFSQCKLYKSTGLTAGFTPNGGGFGEYVKAMPWVAERGIVALPDNVSFEEATFIEPINTIVRSEQHTSELQSLTNLVCRLLPEKKSKQGAVYLRRPSTLSYSPANPAGSQCAKSHASTQSLRTTLLFRAVAPCRAAGTSRALVR